MLNFTVGPVMSSEMVLAIGGEQVPYFRTPEFSDLMFENERLVLKFAKAPEGSRAVFITGSGTASMEAAVVNLLNDCDRIIVVNGGSFGQRFVDLCRIHKLYYSEIKLDYGQPLTAEHLAPYDNKGYTAFLVNIHETSTGVLYDMNMISRFCRSNGIRLIADAISAFLADPIDMSALEIEAMITGSQKALACPPGVSIIMLSPYGVNRVMDNDPHCMYLDLRDALKNGERGQTPFTCAVGILRQINHRLHEIDAAGGVSSEIERIGSIARDFRERIADLPFEIVSSSLSNAVTPLHPLAASAYDVFTVLKDEYGIWICPNGGDLRDFVFRVGHIGHILPEHNTALIDAFKDLSNRGLI